MAKRGHYMGAVPACGPEAVLSHRSAAGPHRHSRKEIQVHRVHRLDPRDVTEHDGIPITTLARTFLDLAEVERPQRIEQALERGYRTIRITDKWLTNEPDDLEGTLRRLGL